MPVPTRSDDVVETIHGVRVRDPYRWLEDGGDPEVRAWVAAQNARTRAYLDALPGRPAIAERIRQALDVGRVATAVPRGRHLFLSRRDAGMDQIVLTVSEAGGPARVLIDPAPLSEDRTTALAWWTPSPDGELVCVGISESGDDNAELRILRTATGEWLPDRIARCPWSAVAFEPGSASILYSRMPEPGTVPRGEEVYHRHVWPPHARAQMAARLQAADPAARVLLRQEPRAGHGQGKPVAKMAPEEADVWSFMLAALGGS